MRKDWLLLVGQRAASASGSAAARLEPMNPDNAQNARHLAIYDYGMGGIWVLVGAASAEAVERRFPWLRVITVGDPAWVTAEKYEEIVTTIGPAMIFELDHPHGWLAKADATLDREGSRPQRASRRGAKPDEQAQMRYQRVEWHHDHPDEPVIFYSEIDNDGWRWRNVDEYRDGRLVRAAHGDPTDALFDVPMPELATINEDDQFHGTTIPADAFEAVWRQAG
jgi:hypothetical protein